MPTKRRVATRGTHNPSPSFLVNHFHDIAEKRVTAPSMYISFPLESCEWQCSSTTVSNVCNAACFLLNKRPQLRIFVTDVGLSSLMNSFVFFIMIGAIFRRKGEKRVPITSTSLLLWISLLYQNNHSVLT